ncbi:hypothetical protein VP1G_02668 [Cytospora mali]|uniref:Uncharacterized protein n=1 Tax=Cytospora mali TaxID=578113 RepID=A0A194UUG7_CYTMA|nr:hypothetical protein VP1G_02668 [Valsa mali var. pyri (nom. inval.)]
MRLMDSGHWDPFYPSQFKVSQNCKFSTMGPNEQPSEASPSSDDAMDAGAIFENDEYYLAPITPNGYPPPFMPMEELLDIADVDPEGFSLSEGDTPSLTETTPSLDLGALLVPPIPRSVSDDTTGGDMDSPTFSSETMSTVQNGLVTYDGHYILDLFSEIQFDPNLGLFDEPTNHVRTLDILAWSSFINDPVTPTPDPANIDEGSVRVS